MAYNFGRMRICTRCKKEPARRGRTKCKTCAKYEHDTAPARLRRKYKRDDEAGKCVRCGVRPQQKTNKRCPKCEAYHQKVKNKRRAELRRLFSLANSVV